MAIADSNTTGATSELILREKVATAAFAFRGYNLANLGRSPELLAHACYGPLVHEVLREASVLCSDALEVRIDLVESVREHQPSSLETFGRDVGLIVAMEVAQVRLLERLFDVEYAKAQMSFGYSVGEVAALVCGGVFALEEVLPPLLTMARECAELARDVTMGVLFSRGPALDYEAVERLCAKLSSEGQGVIAISSFLSPNTVLLLGQGDRIDRFGEVMQDAFPERIYLRKNSGRWPPLHTPLLWERSIPNRAAFMMHSMSGGFRTPKPPVISLVTGKTRYNDFNSRRLLNQWTDHPQRLWDAIYETLAAGVETIVHVGPEPNLIPATYRRLSDNVQVQLSGRSMLGRAVFSIWRPWLSRLLSSRTALLHAPFIQHVILEDWLLSQEKC